MKFSSTIIGKEESHFLHDEGDNNWLIWC